MTAAACPLLAALLMTWILPAVVTDGKQPQPFIRRNIEALKDSRFIVSNNIGMAAALSWELKRDDVFILHDAGELEYGLEYADSRNRLLQKDAVGDWLVQARQQGNVAVFLRVSRDKVEPPPYMPAPDAMSRIDRYILLLYRQRPVF
jgi:4-amino-4-deoxy-L-arabinose transferase